MDTIGKLLLFFGVVMVVIGGLLWGLGKAFGGRMLPGDIVIQRPGFTFIFPIMTSIILSLVLTLIFWLIGTFRR